MAQKTVVTTPDVAANSGQGTPLATAFEWINDNFDEVYAKPDLTLAANILTLTKPDGTTDTVDLSSYLDEDARAIASGTINGSGIVTFTRDDATTFTLDLSSLLDDTVANDATITLSAGSGLTGGGSFTTDQASADTVTFDVNVDDSTIEVATDTVQVKDDGITHAKLEGRYTEILDIATTSGTIALDASSYAAFNLTGTLATATLDIQNIKTGQVVDIILSGSLASAVITLSASTFTTVAINKVGSTSLDTAATNILQVLCVDDTDADAILTWAVASYATGISV